MLSGYRGLTGAQGDMECSGTRRLLALSWAVACGLPPGPCQVSTVTKVPVLSVPRGSFGPAALGLSSRSGDG